MSTPPKLTDEQAVDAISHLYASRAIAEIAFRIRGNDFAAIEAARDAQWIEHLKTNGWRQCAEGQGVSQFFPQSEELAKKLESANSTIVEWLEKTQWVIQTIQTKELGMHRADMMRSRLQALEAQRDELLTIAKRIVEDNSTGRLARDAELVIAKVQSSEPTYDQQALELCEACGWKTLIPGEGCLNCERKPAPKMDESPPWWPAVENILKEYGLQAIGFVADFKAAMAAGEALEREWVGLPSYFFSEMPSEWADGAIAAENKLKELNHG